MIDGGIKAHNAAQVADWGIEVAVVGSGLIKNKGTIAEKLLWYVRPIRKGENRLLEHQILQGVVYLFL